MNERIHPFRDLPPAEEIERLRTLVEASKLINSSIEGEDLYRSILTVARQELDVERGTLFFMDEEKGQIWANIEEEDGLQEVRLPLGQGLAGSVAVSGESVVIHDAYADPRFDPSTDRRTGFRTRSILCVPIRNRAGKIVGVLQLLNKRQGPFGPSDLDFLSALSEHMAIAIENAMLHLDLLAKNRMERELQLGHEIQERLLPAPPTDVPGTRIVARSISCYEVGGDCYDFIPLPGGELGLALGDVSGKGVSAALVMSSFQAALRLAAPLEADLPELLGRLNELLLGMTQGSKYVTLFLARYDPATGRMRYVNAGHNPPILLHEGKAQRIESTSRPLGLFAGTTFAVQDVVLPPGSILALYTDGLTEAASPADDEFGMERWIALLEANADRPIEEILETALDATTRFEDGTTPSDDKTLVILGRDAD